MNKILSSLLLAVLLVASGANAKTRPIKGSSSTSKRALAAAAAYHNHAHVVPTHSRVLKKDDPEDVKPDKDVPVPAAEAPVDNSKNNKDDKTEETDPPVDGDMGGLLEASEAPMANMTDDFVEPEPVVDGEVDGEVDTPDEEEEAIGADELFNVTVDTFTLAVTGNVEAGDLMIDQYLMMMLAPEMDNLQNIYLDVVTTVGGEIVEEEVEEEGMTNETMTGENPDLDNRRRSLRAVATSHKSRVLQGDEKVLYYQGDAEFMGPPSRDTEVVNEAVRTALSNQDTLNQWISSLIVAVEAAESEVATTPGETAADTPAPVPVTVTFQPDEAIPENVADALQEMDSTPSTTNEGLSTTGLTIVIVAAVVGGLSLLIIVFVGMTGPAGPGKSGLPEQPR